MLLPSENINSNKASKEASLFSNEANLYFTKALIDEYSPRL
jgi:hypothetical protein